MGSGYLLSSSQFPTLCYEFFLHELFPYSLAHHSSAYKMILKNDFWVFKEFWNIATIEEFWKLPYIFNFLAVSHLHWRQSFAPQKRDDSWCYEQMHMIVGRHILKHQYFVFLSLLHTNMNWIPPSCYNRIIVKSTSWKHFQISLKEVSIIIVVFA